MKIEEHKEEFTSKPKELDINTDEYNWLRRPLSSSNLDWTLDWTPTRIFWKSHAFNFSKL